MSQDDQSVKRTNILLNRKIIVYLLPSIAMAFAGQVGLILNGIFAGNMISTLALAAVAVCAPVLLITMLVAWWIANGCVVRIGLYLGKNRTDEAGYVLSVSILMTFLIGVVIGAAVFIFAGPISKVLTDAGICSPWSNFISG
jgi:Na+-driven multidrug efflux pump